MRVGVLLSFRWRGHGGEDEGWNVDAEECGGYSCGGEDVRSEDTGNGSYAASDGTKGGDEPSDEDATGPSEKELLRIPWRWQNSGGGGG